MKKLRKLIAYVLIACFLFEPTAMAYAAEKPSVCSDKRTTMKTTSDTSLEATDGLSELFADTIEESEELSEEVNSISGLEISGTTATITYASQQEAEILVAIYTEETEQMLGSGRVIVNSENTSVDITLSMEEMPEYFIAKAYMLDPVTHHALAECYTSNMYTQEMQELLKSSADDYEQSLVVSFDDSEDTNFAVYHDEVSILEESEESNLITDNGDGTYTITNTDESVKALKVGDIFSYNYSDGSILPIKIAFISVDGDTVTIQKDEDLALTDVFEVVKVESDGGGNTVSVDEDTLGEGVSYYGSQWLEEDDLSTADVPEGEFEEESDTETEVTATTALKGAAALGKDRTNKGLDIVDISDTYTKAESFEVKKTVSGKNSSATFQGYASFLLTARVNIYATLNYASVSFGVDANASVGGSLTAEFDGTFPIAVISIYTSVPGLYLQFKPTISLSVYAQATVKLDFETSFGGSYDTKNGWRNTSKSPQFSPQSNAEGKISVGLSGATTLSFVDEGMISATLDPMLVATATLKKNHTCNCGICAAGNLSLVFYVNASAKIKIFGINKNPSKTLYTKQLIGKSFYYSFDAKEWGWGSCPYVGSVTAGSTVQSTPTPVGEITYLGTGGVRIVDGRLKINNVSYYGIGNMSYFTADCVVLSEEFAEKCDHALFDINFYDKNKTKIMSWGGIVGINDYGTVEKINASATTEYNSNIVGFTITNIRYYVNVDQYTSVPLSISSKTTAKTATQINALSNNTASGFYQQEYTDLVNGAPYVIVAVKDSEAETLFAPENLLYITQKNADEKGSLSVDITPRTSESYSLLIFGQEKIDIGSADVSPSPTPTLGVVNTSNPSPSPTLDVENTPNPSPSPALEENNTPEPSVSPITNPSDNTSDGTVAEPAPSPAGNSTEPTISQLPVENADSVNVNDVITIKKLKYKITKVNSDGTGEVSLIGTARKKTDKKFTSLKIGKAVSIKGKAFQVTAIEKGAFQGFKKLKSVMIGKNVVSIGKKAFYKDKSLKKIVIKSSKIKVIGNRAFYGIHKKAVFKFPKSKQKKYSKLLN